MLENVLITGITLLDEYPICGNCEYYKQVIESDALCIPVQKPDIESINELKVYICVEKFKVIKTVLGPKIVIQGTKQVKIIYTADNCQQSLHSAHWDIPFCEFVLMDSYSYDKCLKTVVDVFAGLEDACVKCYDKRTIDISILYILCPQVRKVYDGSNCDDYYEPCRKGRSYKKGWCNK